MNRDAFALKPEMIGAALIGLALLTVFSFIPDTQTGIVLNWARFLVKLVGFGYYLAWLALGYLGVWLIRRFGMENEAEKWEKPLGALLALLLFIASFEVFDPGHHSRGEPGGGGFIGWVIHQLLGDWGVLLFLLPAGLFFVVILLGPWSLQDLAALIGGRFGRLRHQRRVGQIPVNAPARAPALSASNAPPPDLQGSDMPPFRLSSRQVWRLPEIARILKGGGPIRLNPAEARERGQLIEQSLAGLGIEAVVREINQGPVVTQFALELGHTNTRNPDGSPRRVSVKKIASLNEDLSLALSASPIRIEAPIPGKPYVGIEAPNRQRSPVTLRGILEGAGVTPLTYPKRKLSVPLGQSVDGEAIFIDLAELPHLLIAGATGSGKSVCLNTIIAGLLCYHTPDTLRLLMLDPKLVELAQYNGIPHLLAPVVTEIEQATGILAWATREMDRRYQELARSGSRNIGAHNAKVSQIGGNKLPFIVLVIDELADLMMIASDLVEQPIVRLAQKARAVGIHLVVATQRPSTDVITGLLKANFPARIAFAVSSQIDSRVIIDTPGAEKLLGQGDMLYQSPRSVRLQRLQGAYVSDDELLKLAKFWKRQSKSMPQAQTTAQQVQAPPQPSPAVANGSNDASTRVGDDLLRQGIALVQEEGKATISLLQRKLRIGYARAAGLIDAMEAQGVIGPATTGGRAREVL